MCASAEFEERAFAGVDETLAIVNNVGYWKDLANKLRLFMKPLKCMIKLMDHDCHCTVKLKVTKRSETAATYKFF